MRIIISILANGEISFLKSDVITDLRRQFREFLLNQYLFNLAKSVDTKIFKYNLTFAR